MSSFCFSLSLTQVSLGLLHAHATHILWPPGRWQRLQSVLPPERLPVQSEDQWWVSRRPHRRPPMATSAGRGTANTWRPAGDPPSHAKMTKESLKTLNGMKWHLLLWSIVIPDCFMPKKHTDLCECEGVSHTSAGGYVRLCRARLSCWLLGFDLVFASERMWKWTEVKVSAWVMPLTA